MSIYLLIEQFFDNLGFRQGELEFGVLHWYLDSDTLQPNVILVDNSIPNWTEAITVSRVPNNSTHHAIYCQLDRFQWVLGPMLVNWIELNLLIKEQHQ